MAVTVMYSLGLQLHPNRRPQLGPSRESRTQEHTLTVRPGPLNPTAFCYNDPNHCTPALHLPHSLTSLVSEEDVKTGNYSSSHTSRNFRPEVKTGSKNLPKPSSGFFH